MSYDSVILGDSPTYYWETNETSGTNAADSADSNTGTYRGTVTLAQAGPAGLGNATVLLDGSTGFISTATQLTNPQGPLSIEFWFKMSGSTSGPLFGFLNAQLMTGGTSLDRHIYIGSTDKKVYWGIFTTVVVTVNSSATVNDGNWHHVVATLASNNNMGLYLDTVSASNSNTNAATNYNGWWHLGGDQESAVTGWPQGVSNNFFSGNVAKFAIYSSVLSSTQVTNHYNAGLASSSTVFTPKRMPLGA